MPDARAGQSVPTATADATASRPAHARRAVPSWVVPVAAGLIAVLDLTVFWAMASRGSWYSDDLDILAASYEAENFGLDYLTLPVNDHLVPGWRAVNFAFAHLAPLDHTFTIAVRAAFILAAIGAMYRLLVLMLGRRPIVLLPLLFYAVMPLALPSELFLSSAVSLLPVHVASILFVDCCLRFALTCERRFSMGAVASLAVAICFWEKSVLIVPIAALLIAGFALSGPWRWRVAETVRMWRLWIPVAAVLVLFAWAWLATRDASAIAEPDLGSVSDMAELARMAWLESVGPALIGGPWQWSHPTEGNYLGFADPPLAGVIAGQLAVLAVAWVAFRRVGGRSLVAWAMLGWHLAGNALVLGLGRTTAFGDLPGRYFHYWSELAVTTTIVLTCALWRLDPAQMTARAADPAGSMRRRSDRTMTVPDVVQSRRAAVGVAVFLGSVALTAHTFMDRWDDNRSGEYLDTMRTDLAARPGIALYDVPVATHVLASIYENRHLSDLTPMMDLDVSYDDDIDVHIVDDDGHVVPAALDAWARAVPGDDDFCSYIVRGEDRVVVPLDQRIGAGEWFMRMAYFSSTGGPIRVEVDAPRSDPVVVSASIDWSAGLAGRIARISAPDEFDRVVFTGLDDRVNLCVTDVVVGVPSEKDQP